MISCVLKSFNSGYRENSLLIDPHSLDFVKRIRLGRADSISKSAQPHECRRHILLAR